MATVISFLVLAGIGLLVYVSIRAKSRYRHSMDSAYAIPEDMRRADDQPPPEADTGWMINPR
ncbi:MAG: hypothetical protein JWR52_876 [Marmoricola sp.]|nr:hypothetical protein [Marmoricola sp.]